MSSISRNEAFEPKGVLKPGYHDALFEDLHRLSQAAGLAGAKRFIVQSCKEFLDGDEIRVGATLKRRIADGVLGTIYTGDVPRVSERFMALTGSFMRNYVNARFMTLNHAIEEYRSEGFVDATILLIPDFHVPLGASLGRGGMRSALSTHADRSRLERSSSKPQFIVDTVTALLLDRIGSGQYTYLYSEDPDRLEQDFGPYVVKLLRENYDVKASAGQSLAA